MTRLSFLLSVCCFVFLCACSPSKSSKSVVKKSKPRGVHFTSSNTLSAVLDKAERENKLVFVDFYASWCTPCKMMDKDVFSDKGIAQFMNKHFINYKVNGEKGNGNNLATIFEVNAYPTLLFLDAKGKVLERKVGAAYHTELKAMANRALASK